jgi:hypothetical protein
MTEAILTALARLARKPAVLPFGKYKGKRLDRVVFDDPAYIGWCLCSEVRWVEANILHKDEGPCLRRYEEALADHAEAMDEMYWDFLD